MVRSLIAVVLALQCAAAFIAPIAPLQARSVAVTRTDLGSVQMIRHGNKNKKLNRPTDQRKALLRGLTTELIRHGRIRSTLAHCKEVRTTADHMITLAKTGTLHARRQALGYIYDKQLVHSLFEQVPDRYAERNGGYTRVLKDGFRRGDNAEMGTIELM